MNATNAPAWWLDPTIWWIGTIGLLAIVVLLFAVLLLSRRRYAMDAREVVRAMEDLRSGEFPDTGHTDAGSPLALVFDAMQRLGQDVGARMRSYEEAGTRAQRMIDVLEDVAIIDTDVDGDIRSVSAGAQAMLGWEESELLGQSAAILFDEDDYKAFLPKLARRELREQGIGARVRLQRRDKRTFPADLIVRQSNDKRSNATGFVVRIRDRSERVDLERRLAAAERQYDALLAGLSAGVVLVRGGRLLFANRRFATLFDADPKALLGQPLRDRIATQDLLAVEEALATVEAGGEPISMNCRLVDASGGALAEAQLDACGLDSDEGRSVLAVLHDRTDQARVEEELRRNERRLDSVIEAASDGILLLVEGPAAARVQMVNAAFGKLFALQPESLLGATEAELLAALSASGEAGREVAELIGHSGHTWRKETIERRGARRVDLEVTLVPLVDRQRRPQGRVVACRDLSAQRDTERTLQMHAEQLQLSKVMLEQAYRSLEESNRDLLARTDQLRSVNAELRKLDEMKSNLMGNVSHELQTPLVSIRGYTEMILRERLGPTTDEQKKGLELCLTNIDRLISMIDNLLVLARSESDESPLKLQHFDLRGVVAEAAELLREKIVEREIRFSTQIEGEDLRIHGDRDKLLQVLINLLSNAIKFNKQNGRVRVTARIIDPHGVEVCVEDSGSGIPEADRERVFERHFQVKESGHKTEGSGIGLSIVKEILDSHGCRIAVESAVGEGARFRFTLPLSSQQSGRLAPPPEPRVEPTVQSPAAPVDDVSKAPQETPEDAPVEPRPRFRIIRPQPPRG